MVTWPHTVASVTPGHLRRNRHLIPNYNERRLAGEPISSATAEATVNHVIAKRMVKSNRCAGHPPVPTGSSNSAPALSTAPSNKPSPHDLPRKAPVSRIARTDRHAERDAPATNAAVMNVACRSRLCRARS